MKNILISGLVNTETTCRVRQFPIDYYPIDYPFFGVNTAVSGVAYNPAKAMTTLGDRVKLLSMTGGDFAARYIREELSTLGIDTAPIKANLSQTPSSVVLYDESGRRQIYCDLKDIQEAAYGFTQADVENADIVAACNINFNRPLLALAKQMGKTIATDVHVLRDIHDDYNRDFLEAADILFLSDEGAWEDHYAFIQAIEDAYHTPIIVMGRGSRGALMYLRDDNWFHDMPAAHVGDVVNTVGAGDALFSSFLHYYAKGLHPVECLRRAQIFAAAKIRVSGASKGFVTEAEVEEMLTWK